MIRLIFFIIAAFILSFLLAGCHKFYIDQLTSASSCKIETMTVSDSRGGSYHRVFEYDEFGNPISVKVIEDEDGTGYATFDFTYNDRHQLTACDGFSDHRYTYNARGQIIIDSSYVYYTGGDSRYEDLYYYDNLGRIVKVVSKFYYDFYGSEEVGTIRTGEFHYDERGNLIKPGILYDDKVNIYRTHPIWMFLHRNYSVNNEIGPAEYNEEGLPISYQTDRGIFLELPAESVTYKCDNEAMQIQGK